jgi:thiosulfate dehydrogenase (quinone) large subunit
VFGHTVPEPVGTGTRRIGAFRILGEEVSGVSGMAWVRILVGAVWLNGALEKLLSPSFPQQFALSLEAGGFVAAAPSWFQGLMRGLVVPNAEFVAQLARFGELTLGLALLLGLLTNPAAIGSIFMSLAIMLSQGQPRFGMGLGAPEFLNVNLLLALLSLVILLSPGAKDLALDASLARARPNLAPLLTNRRSGRRGRSRA